MSILRLIKTIGKDIESRYEDVNWGGCGVVALHLGRQLEGLGIDCEVVVMSREEVSTGDVLQYKEENGSASFQGMEDEFCFDYNHILIKFKHRGRTYLADSEGVYSSFEQAVRTFTRDCDEEVRYPVHGISLNDLEKEVKDGDNWNTTFNRKQIPGITATIAKHFRKYKKTNKKKWWRVA